MTTFPSIEERKDLVKNVHRLLIPWVAVNADRRGLSLSQSISDGDPELARAAITKSMELLDGLLEAVKEGIRLTLLQRAGIDNDLGIQTIDSSELGEVNRACMILRSNLDEQEVQLSAKHALSDPISSDGGREPLRKRIKRSHQPEESGQQHDDRSQCPFSKHSCPIGEHGNICSLGSRSEKKHPDRDLRAHVRSALKAHICKICWNRFSNSTEKTKHETWCKDICEACLNKRRRVHGNATEELSECKELMADGISIEKIEDILRRICRRTKGNEKCICRSKPSKLNGAGLNNIAITIDGGPSSVSKDSAQEASTRHTRDAMGAVTTITSHQQQDPVHSQTMGTTAYTDAANTTLRIAEHQMELPRRSRYHALRRALLDVLSAPILYRDAEYQLDLEPSSPPPTEYPGTQSHALRRNHSEYPMQTSPLAELGLVESFSQIAQLPVIGNMDPFLNLDPESGGYDGIFDQYLDPHHAFQGFESFAVRATMVNFDWALAGIEERLDIQNSWSPCDFIGVTNKPTQPTGILEGGITFKTEPRQAPMFAPSVPRSDDVEASGSLQRQVMEQMVVLSKIRTRRNNEDHYWRSSSQQQTLRVPRRLAPRRGAYSQSNTTIQSRGTLRISGLNTPGPESVVESSVSLVSEIDRPEPECLQNPPHPVTCNPGLDLEFKLEKLKDKLSFADRLFDPALSLSYMGLGTCKPDGFQPDEVPRFSRFDLSGFQSVLEELPLLEETMDYESIRSECTESQETEVPGRQRYDADTGDE